jgi:hypothetical protein
MTHQIASRLTFGLGVLSVLAVILANLALIDIYHGEPDVTLEWNAVRVSFLIILVFHAFALTAAWKALNQAKPDGSA